MTIEGINTPSIRLQAGEGRADSVLRKLKINGKPFSILKQRGAIRSMAYDHGRLLAEEIDTGVFPEVIATIARGVDLDTSLERRIAAAIYRTYTDRVLDNVSDEFRDAATGLAEGYSDGSARPRFSRQDVLDASVAIEVGNLVDGLARLIEIPWARIGAIIEAAVLSLPALIGDDEAHAYLGRAGEDAEVRQGLARTLKRMASPNNRVDFACTAFCVPWGFTRNRLHLHARNLDADLYHWNNAPVLFLMDETPSHPNAHRYVAFGTAGMIYPGGISGLNDAGLAVSSHQMSTTQLTSGFLFGKGDIGPFLQQRILRDAANVEEAIQIATENKHFAAWTIFCSEAKTGLSARIEINGEQMRVTRITGNPVPQTNHFVHEDFVERQFDEDDAHFTPTFGKWLETRARFSSTQAALNAARDKQIIDVDWAIDHLVASKDWFVSEILTEKGLSTAEPACDRAFGRVPRKVYGQLSSIVCADPQRRAGRDEAWMTIGERQPGPQGSFVGFNINWDDFELAPVSERPVRRTLAYVRSGREHWEQSLERYVWSRMTLTRPRNASGLLIRRAQTNEERDRGLGRAASLLDSAVELAAADGIVEVPYHYMRARLRHEQGQYAAAKTDWDLLLDIWAMQNDQPRLAINWPVAQLRYQPVLLAYEAGLVSILSTVTEDKLRGSKSWPGRQDRINQARTLLTEVKTRFFGDKGPAHFDLERWLESIDVVEQKEEAEVDWPEPNFITAE